MWWWIDEMRNRIQRSWATPDPAWYRKQALLKKRLDVLAAQLRSASKVFTASTSSTSSTTTAWYVTQSDCWGQIVQSYDIMMTDVYKTLSYLQLLDYYTKRYTNNRWYYSRKSKQLYNVLETRYTSTPDRLYTMWQAAREWFFTEPTRRKPLHYYLFYHLLSLQNDDKS